MVQLPDDLDVRKIKPELGQLLADRKEGEARDLALRDAFVDAPDPAAQARFVDRFPPPPEPERGVEALLEAVASSDSPDRARAGRKLNSLARGNWTKARGAWLTDPRVVGKLLAALATADPKTVVEVAGALGALSKRYTLNDPRIRRHLIALWPEATDAVKLAVVQAVCHFGDDDVWRLAVESLSCRPPKQAQHVVGLAVARYGVSAGVVVRAQLARGLEAACAKQKNLEVLDTVVIGLAVAGDLGSIDVLSNLKGRSIHLDDRVDKAIARITGEGS